MEKGSLTCLNTVMCEERSVPFGEDSEVAFGAGDTVCETCGARFYLGHTVEDDHRNQRARLRLSIRER